jgi:hypothetical protein
VVVLGASINTTMSVIKRPGETDTTTDASTEALPAGDRGVGRSGGNAFVRLAEALEDGDGLGEVVSGHVRECLLDRRGRVGQVRAGQLAEPRDVAGADRVVGGGSRSWGHLAVSGRRGLADCKPGWTWWASARPRVSRV